MLYGGCYMSLKEALLKRRSIYALNKDLPVSEDEIIKTVEETVALIPDAFDCKSQRVIVVFGDKQDELWDAIFEAFNGQIAKEKTDSFKAAAGTVLYFTDKNVTNELIDTFPMYASSFPIWNMHANSMLQIAVWTSLTELGLGANLQHYNPVIDKTIKCLFDIPDSYQLVAQMPFGGITADPIPKDEEDISKRVTIFR